MQFNIHITALQSALLATMVVTALLFCLYYLPPLLKIARWRRRCNEEAKPLAADKRAASVSVIVYSRDDIQGLERLIPRLLQQYYEGDFEVIVVNEGECAPIRDYIDSLQLTHRNLYLTHTPDGARSLSRKKLAITLGIKAARGEVVLLTTATSMIDSDRWIAEMLRPFNSDAAIELVAGMAIPREGEDSSRGKRRRAFDFSADCATWLSAALRQRPYRGIEQNLAYRRELFFNNKGFSRSLNIRHGDDDIFVNEVARSDNSTVQLSDDSVVRFDGDIFNYTYPEDAAKRAFTERFVRRGARRRMALGSLLPLLWLVCAAAALWLDRCNWLTVVTTAVSGIAILTAMLIGWRSVLTAFHSRRLLLTIPGLLVTRPLRKAYYKLRSRRGRNRTY